MPVTVSTTTPSVVGSYSDPVRALNIKALEKRHAEMLQAQAQMGAITPENTQTPWQGMGHVLNQLGSSVQAGQAERKAQDARDRLSAVMAGIDWEKGPTPQQLAFITNANDALGTKLIEQGATSRENQRTRQHEVGQQQARFGHETGQQTQRLAHEEQQQGRLFGQQDRTLAATQAHTTVENEQERAFRRDQQAGSQAHETRLTNLRAQIDQAKQERDHAHQTGQADRLAAATQTLARLNAELTSEENRKGETFKASQLQEQLKSDRELKRLGIEAQATENMLNRSAEYRNSQEGREATARLQENKIEAEARAAVLQRMHEEKLLDTKTTAEAKVRASDPTRVKGQKEIEQEALAAEALMGDLDQAKAAFDGGKGINLGRYAGMATGLPQMTGGVIGDRQRADNTVLFDNIMGKVAITAMGPMLKGQSTDYEMRTFLEMFNNKNISVEAKRAQFARVIEHAEKNRNVLMRATKAVGGDTSGPAPAAPAATGGGAAAPAATGGGNIMDVANEADIQKLPPGSRFRFNGRTGTVQ